MKFYQIHLTLLYLVSCLQSPAFSTVISTLISPCLNLTAAVWISDQSARSLSDCYWRSRLPSASVQSVQLVHFHNRNRTCALFRYKDICQFLNMTDQLRLQQASFQLQQQQPQECESLVDSKYDMVTANAYFSAVWISSNGGALENIVCGAGGVRNALIATNVVWTLDGAQMNGVNSQLLMTDPIGLNFSQAVTMVLELKRTPGPQPFMELTDCSSYSAMFSHLWEYPGAGQMYLNPMSTSFLIRSQPGLMTNDSNEFFKVGASFDYVRSRNRFYYGSSSVPNSSLQYAPIPYQSISTPNCVKIGFRNVGQGATLNGTVKMAGIAGAFLLEDIVSSFLSGC